jgi:hypothetical protein
MTTEEASWVIQDHEGCLVAWRGSEMEAARALEERPDAYCAMPYALTEPEKRLIDKGLSLLGAVYDWPCHLGVLGTPTVHVLRRAEVHSA